MNRSPHTAMLTRQASRAGEEGFIAGAESLAFGVLVFVVGALLVVSGWTVVDAKLAVEAAAREGARAVVESPVADLTGSQADVLARRVAVAGVAAHRGDPADPGATWRLVEVRLSGQRVRCGMITARVTIDVDTVDLPIIGGGFGTVRLVGEHRERIEPYRAGLPVPPGGIACT